MELEVVAVRFNEGEKAYYFDPDGRKYRQREKVICQTKLGLEVGEVVRGNFSIDSNDFDEELEKILRKMTEKDKDIVLSHEKKEKEIFKEAERIIKEMELNMKLLSAKYTFEGNKIIFTYSSETRVDFRQLLKEFASKFHARIELKQIGIRDEAKFFGGLGPCGREICCRRCLSDLDKVSLKYAKNQGLSLNSSKLSGMCGRLMCCLAYENSMYVEILQKMPKINSKVKTKEGEGVVVYNNILKETVTVKIEEDDTTKLIEFGMEEVEKI